MWSTEKGILKEEHRKRGKGKEIPKVKERNAKSKRQDRKIKEGYQT